MCSVNICWMEGRNEGREGGRKRDEVKYRGKDGWMDGYEKRGLERVMGGRMDE